MRITFWGVRGSIPCPGPDTVGVGGNTSCVEVRAGKALLVFDGGTGLRLLGKRMLKEMPFTAHLFFSHVHWDHIQGFPFFDPAFVAGNVIHLYGGNNVSRTLEETLAGQMDHPSFPVHLSEMGAEMVFHGVSDRSPVEVDAGDGAKAVIRAAPGNHPNGVWAYRVDYAGRSVVYATDTEHYAVVDPKLTKLAQGADVLIYDSQYTPEEYAGQTGGGPKLGWGHSTFEEAVKLAKAANAERLILYHHDPMQSDAAVAEKEKRARALFPNTEAAREGLVIEL
ncbi:MAG: MBL fold metallo-hydrolase [Labilithrix sp.]|nr:MBL fold metallo-hydrolase [Labilithrix sp.]MCW5833059.1 MBL fold metallo-hydrolase [Labilithrix sp.]